MDEFLRRLTQLHRRDLPVEPGADQGSSSSSSSSSSSGFLDALISATTSSPGYPDNNTLFNDTSSTTVFPMTTGGEEEHVRSNAAFPLSSFAVIKVVILAMVLGILLLTSCRVVGKLVCKNSSKEQSE